MMTKTAWIIAKIVVFSLSLCPFLWLIDDLYHHNLGANPVQTLHFRLGDWALRFLVLGLAITPLRKITGIHQLIRFRRMIGLYAFFYATLHFLLYLSADLSFSWAIFLDEAEKSPYILAGLFTYAILLPLAITSLKYLQKKLARHWLTLHRLVYLAALSAVLHYFWLVKKDITQPLIYAGCVFLLFSIRLGYFLHARTFQRSVRLR
jgi:sulfoxide reductase heme-binding subunit YedZ